jgi:hypothetical protein
MTKVQLYNRALALLPHDILVSEENEESTEAMRCRQHLDAARKSVLTAREWGWLVRETPACNGACWGGSWMYDSPSDALLVLGLCTPDGRRVRADAVNGGLRSLEPFAAVRYLPDSQNPDDWPFAVQEAVAVELAARICPVLTDNAQRSAQLRQEAVARLEEAGRQDAQQTSCGGGDPLVFVHARR